MKAIAFNRWIIRVCKHGHRVEWRQGVDRWLHMDSDAALCNDPEPRAVYVKEVRPDEHASDR